MTPPLDGQAYLHLLDRLLDETIEPAERDALQEMLRTSHAARRHYVRYVHQHANVPAALAATIGNPATADADAGAVDGSLLWEQVLKQRLVSRQASPDEGEGDEAGHDSHDGAMSVATSPVGTHAYDAEADRSGPVFSFAGIHIYRGDRGTKSVGRTFKISHLAAAAVLLAVAAWSAFTWLMRPDAPPAPDAAQQPEVAHTEAPPAVLPRMAATVRRTHNASWDHDVAPRAGVQLYENARFDLTAGYIELAMPRGTSVILEAPCTVQLVTDNKLRLDRGKLTAYVPKRDLMFTVETPTARVVDLGTSFGVHVRDDRATHAAVFEGLVELREVASADNPFPRAAQLSQGLAGAVEADGQLRMSVEEVDGAIELSFARNWQQVTEGMRVSGAIRYTEDPPTTVVPDRQESDDHLLLFRERRDFPLPRELSVVPPPASSQMLDVRAAGDAPIAADTRVDVYFLHFDTVGRRRADSALRLSGSMDFGRKILGLIVEKRELLETSSWLGHPAVRYAANDALLGLEVGEDVIRVGEDGQSIFFDLACSNGVDQLRVIVAPQSGSGDRSTSP